ncbi:uncharacterized protein BX663DRAFT_501654 [Cokeromyces recurvatus]|uniref:uncharacterized protein n=1 Tax=Cokeromyces recurvatus TaxID=90255 RepID=UPI0022208AD2|nr:uncharacterized protein BX663DRAFT_501654 [Cokeromyces recurvatus]KAI7905084.1 hypothetical protein BX663DRAFT_501654 [Cokeromyces recurvatus]
MKSKLEKYLLNSMFENALFSDLSLVFIHPSYPFSMRFNVHKSIVSQSPFLRKLLKNMDIISNSQEDEADPSTNTTQTLNKDNGVTCLTIDLAKAFAHCGFILAPFQHIVRRKWQKTTNNNSIQQKKNEQFSYSTLLASHIRFVLKWMYCLDKQELIQGMQDKDTLRILSVAVLLDVHDLAQACVNRYTSKQLTLDSIMRDLETICQLPRGHDAYLQLRDAALLLLFRFGPEYASQLAMLPVDYMADVLCADLLFVSCEFERYCLLRAVLIAFMQSVGKITWTAHGPVDQDSKRLSGFVRPLGINNNKLYDSNKALTADVVRSRKRKRIPSEDLENLPTTTTKDNLQKLNRLNRLSFSALVPFEKLMADASSGGVIDKATVLSYLLRTTVHYSNMTFEQLTSVRQDGIVDEGIVFRALWQREALERVLFPSTYHVQTQEQENEEQRRLTLSENDERSAALNEYFDVDNSDAHEKRRRLLLGTPRFRFRSSVFIPPFSEENSWDCELKEATTITTDMDMGVFDDDESDGSVWSLSDNENDENRDTESDHGRSEADTSNKQTEITTSNYKLYKKIFYSQVEKILGVSYRVQIEAQVMPRHRLYIKENQEDNNEEELFYEDHDPNENVLVCRFELQRDMRQIALPPIEIKKENNNKHFKTNDEIIPVKPPSQKRTTQTKNPETNPQKTKIHYWIHCLNRHEGILENDRIDPEDRALIAVTEQCEREDGEPGEMEPGYVGQVLINADMKKGVTIDTTVTLEIFGFNKV